MDSKDCQRNIIARVCPILSLAKLAVWLHVFAAKNELVTIDGAIKRTLIVLQQYQVNTLWSTYVCVCVCIFIFMHVCGIY